MTKGERRAFLYDLARERGVEAAEVRLGEYPGGFARSQCEDRELRVMLRALNENEEERQDA